MKVNLADKKFFMMITDSVRRHLYDIVTESGFCSCEVFRIVKTCDYEVREYRGWKKAIQIHTVNNGQCGMTVGKFNTLLDAIAFIRGKGLSTNLPIPSEV